MYKYIFLGLFVTLGNPTEGFNYTEILLERNPFLAREVIEEYSNFSESINSALGLPVEAEKFRGHGGSSSNLEGGGNSTVNAKSAVGIASIMALLNENIWGGVKKPGFEHVRARFRKDTLPELMGILFRSAEQDYNTKIRNVIFTPSWVKAGINMANLRGEIKQTFFQFPEKAMDIVNDVIRRRFGNSANFPDMLTESLPDTTQAMILSTKEQRGHWPGFTDYAGTGTFRSNTAPCSTCVDDVDMFEIRGNFRFWKDDQFQFVTVPFENTKLQVTLVLPNESSKDASPNWDELLATNITEEHQNIRLRLPVKTFFTRNSIKVENTTQCENNKDNTRSSPCLHLLDSITYTSFSPTEFQFITLTGAYINNPYLSHFKTKSSNVWKSPIPPLESWRWFLPPRKQFRSRHASYPSSWSWLSPFLRHPYSSYDFNASNFAEERIMIFDRPFYWFVRGSI